MSTHPEDSLHCLWHSRGASPALETLSASSHCFVISLAKKNSRNWVRIPGSRQLQGALDFLADTSGMAIPGTQLLWGQGMGTGKCCHIQLWARLWVSACPVSTQVSRASKERDERQQNTTFKGLQTDSWA